MPISLPSALPTIVTTVSHWYTRGEFRVPKPTGRLADGTSLKFKPHLCSVKKGLEWLTHAILILLLIHK